MFFFVEPSLLRCLISCCVPPCVVRFPCLVHVFLIFLVSSLLLFFVFFYQSSSWVSKKKCRFVFGKKSFKNYLRFFFHIFTKKTLFFLLFVIKISCNFIFCARSFETFCLFSVFSTSFWKNILFLLSLSLRFCSTKKHTKKVVGSLLRFLFTSSS